MKRKNIFIDPRFLLCLTLPLLLAFAPHDEKDGPKGIGNSAPPGIGGNGPWSRHNMELLSRLTLTEIGSGGAANVLGNDCWGWIDPLDGKEYAICGLTNGTSFIDVTDPRDPKYLGKLPTQTGNSAWRDMKVYANHVFVVSDGNGDHGMQIFDLTELRNADPDNPGNFANTAWYDAGIGSAHNIAINEDSGYAYIVGCNLASGGLHVVDISNPLAPVTAGNFAADGYTHDVQVVNYDGPDTDYAGSEIAFACNEDTVTIVDVTDKSNMTMISRNAYAEDEYTHQGWLSADHRYFYMGDELDESRLGGNTRTHIFDCQDLDNPTYLGYFSHSTNSIDHNLYTRDGFIYCGNYSSGIRVLDATDPENPVEVANFDTFNTNSGVNFSGVWSVFPYFDSDTILVNDRQNGMFLVRLRPVKFEYPNGRPEIIDSKGALEFTVEAKDLFGSPVPNTGSLHVDRGNGFEEFPMTQVSNNVYEAEFPRCDCGTKISYFVSVMATDGTMICDPENDPAGAFEAYVADSTTTAFQDDFESDQGWTIDGDAGDGQWDRGIPAGGGDRADPPNDADGSGRCFVTDNADGNSDVDDGSTVLTSPLMDATGPYATDAILSYYRWYSNDFGSSPGEDSMLVEISNDAGSNWITLEEVGPSGNETSGGWFRKQFRISDFVTPTDKMQVRFTASDLGDGSIIEAGIDGVEITLLNCAVDVPVDSYAITTGRWRFGTIEDLDTSDNKRLRINSTILNSSVVIEVDSTSPTQNPICFELVVETIIRFATANYDQTVELYNYNTGQFEVVDVQPASVGKTEKTFVIQPSGDLSRFVESGTDAVRARVTQSISGGGPRKTHHFDKIVWRILE